MPLDLALRLTLALVLGRCLLNALEVLGSARDYRAAGAFGWPARRLQYAWTQTGTATAWLDVCLGGRSFLVLQAMQACACLSLLFNLLFSRNPPSHVLLWSLLGFEFISAFRNGALGYDGSDRMHLLELLSLAMCFTLTDGPARAVGATFLALQAVLAYVTSGAVKALAPRWRDGRALPLVLSSQNYGLPSLGVWMERNPTLGRLLGWSVIAFELGFPLPVLLGPRPTLALLALGFLFHLGIAVVMGLNGFLWSFVATYPAVYWLSLQLHARFHPFSWNRLHL